MSDPTMHPGGAATSSAEIVDGELVFRVRLPKSAGEPRSDEAESLLFIAYSEAYSGAIRWYRYREAHKLLTTRIAEANATGTAGPTDAFTRVYDPLCQVAASYAAVSGMRQGSAERFIDAAHACFERIPAIGRLMRDGVITPAWFLLAVDQVSLVDDPELLEFIDADAAHRLTTTGALSARRVENAVAAIVAKHDPDAVVQTREQARASKKLIINPLNESASEVIISASKEDAIICKDSIDAVIAGVCKNDPRTRGELRSDAAVARLSGTPFVCRCDRDDCEAELSPESIASRCAKVVLHVVVRQETLDGESATPAVMDGHGPISDQHVRDLAARLDAIRRPLDLGDLNRRMAQPGNPYRPTSTLAIAMRGLFGACSWVGCDRPAWRCDLDHVTEFDHTDPTAGGPTCACNLNPKCKFHHGLKTHADGWLDDQIIDANGVVWTEITTPEGVTVRQQAENTWLLPEIGLIPCTHGLTSLDATRRGTRHADDSPRRTLTRLEAKHRYRLRRRAENRRRREAELAAISATEPTDDTPPY